MSEKILKSRIIHKHDSEENFKKATGFIPKQAELVVYDPDENNPNPRMKIGDGVRKIGELPFVTDIAKPTDLIVNMTAGFVTGKGIVYSCDTPFTDMWAAYEDGGNVMFFIDGIHTSNVEFLIARADDVKSIHLAYINGTNYFEYTINEDNTVTWKADDLITRTTLQQETGTSTTKVMTQKAVTDALALKADQTALDEVIDTMSLGEQVIDITDQVVDNWFDFSAVESGLYWIDESKNIDFGYFMSGGLFSVIKMLDTFANVKVVNAGCVVGINNGSIASIKKDLHDSNYNTLTTTNKTILGAINELDTETSSLSALVGDTSVSDQIGAAIDAIPSDIFYINVAGNDTNGYTSDKNYDEIKTAFEEGKLPYVIYDSYGFYLADTYTGNFSFQGFINGNTHCIIQINDRHNVVISKSTMLTGDTKTLSTTSKTVIGAINELDSELSNITSGSTIVAEATHATTADKATNADHATTADSATTANSATKATQDASGNVITTTYETKTDAAAKLTESKSYTDTAIANLVNSAPETLDTLGELAIAFEENEEVVSALNNAITTKASQEDLNALSALVGDKSVSTQIEEAIQPMTIAEIDAICTMDDVTALVIAEYLAEATDNEGNTLTDNENNTYVF